MTMSNIPSSGKQLRSLITEDGQLELSLVDEPVSNLADDEVLVRVEATPINPSDLGLLVSFSDLDGAVASGSADSPVVTAPVPPAYMRAVTARIGQSLPVGNEGAGVVIAAGAAPTAQALIGRTVALAGGGMYAQYRVAKVGAVLPMPDEVTPLDAASSFVNPLTALGFLETMRREGHTALINTAAASNLGQMLVRLCQADGIELVNIVRSQAQAELLGDLGAVHICNSGSETFFADLVSAIAATGATIGFDAIGGGKLTGQILTAMEAALSQTASAYSLYGSSTRKRVYIYGALDPGPTEIRRSFGLSWDVGGWLVTPFLAEVGPEVVQRLRARVVAELKTTFASSYSQEISLAQALNIDTLRDCRRTATGEKYLIRPNKPL
ncbi:MAG TPA: zinc-binding dehydrogenase [Jiangellaceae bacterium]|nr:zinc-binding dehydrogenase [Jiangellaceae bacterium]